MNCITRRPPFCYSRRLNAGIVYAVSETATLELRYRYFSIGNLEFDTIRPELRSHNFSSGLRVSFQIVMRDRTGTFE